MQSNIQAGRVVKPQPGTMTITFPQPFTNPPVVVIGSEYGEAGTIGNVDGIQSISSTYFVVNSANAAPDYFINWIAYGS